MEQRTQLGTRPNRILFKDLTLVDVTFIVAVFMMSPLVFKHSHDNDKKNSALTINCLTQWCPKMFESARVLPRILCIIKALHEVLSK